MNFYFKKRRELIITARMRKGVMEDGRDSTWKKAPDVNEREGEL